MPAGKSGLQWGNFKAKALAGETAGRGKRRICGMSMAAVGHFNRRQGGFLPNCAAAVWMRCRVFRLLCGWIEPGKAA
ncbi:hypothetical protein [Kingella pumchi]|jgi:hypothetical protein|uniref:Uncharacterized protein n=1 Tax=Kingella pumchi TaxID=2779506 RepID=A0ABS9NK76_9NEIS|nr:hypothetical protein [Kingella pumchi]MCG6503196.1 hypothetical protein [Kingella pumchi]